ncbi:MAG: hypothetical protein JWP14_2983 [Frankiales bacterium]|jgi:hypothetical protein|nr:hypothetical protein [Frankiales bacterium]
MCTYETAHVPLAASSGKGTAGWFRLEEATVYLDHPVDAPLDHSLNVDFRRGAERVAVELDPAGARELAVTILTMLAAAPVALLKEGAPDG